MFLECPSPGYRRISSDRDGQQLGVRRQLADCEALAARKGWEVAERYVDDDVSAYSGRPRVAYRRTLDDIRFGEIDAVVVWHLDRLHRQPKELEEFFEVCEGAGVRWMASVTGDVDLATHDGQFMARILGAVARKESDDKSRRLKRKALELAEAGRRSGGGTRGYGYEAAGRTIRPDEAAVIRDCAERFLAGESLHSLCTSLSDAGIPTVTGKPWRTVVLRRMLASGRISGQREHHGTC
jgi:DNA invertase Pin-like site-specific DNA recombinase